MVSQAPRVCVVRIEGNGVRTVIVEDASRFARELVTQELGILALIRRGVRVLTAAGDDLTDSSDPSRVMMRRIAGSFARVPARTIPNPRIRGRARPAPAHAIAVRAIAPHGFALRVFPLKPNL